MIKDPEKVYIVRCGETALKGQNKPYFERMLLQRIRRVLKDFGGCQAERLDGLIFVRAPETVSREDLLRRVGHVFGVDSVSPAWELNIQDLTDQEALDQVGLAAVAWMKAVAESGSAKTFKVEAKRADKRFSIQSPQIASIIGGKILRGCKVLTVDVHHPDCALHTDFRRGFAYIYDEVISGYGGLPLGTNGKGLVLLSGGIDSPVAAFLMAHRGMLIEAVHFHSFPYTSQRAWEKVKDLGGILTVYCERIRIHSINLLPVQEQIAEKCPPEQMTLLVRRYMMKIARIIAEQTECNMLITGENLGQVASQTAEAIVVTDHAAGMPVMRPLIAMDKVDIMDTARQIGTYETSILPYEDCCTVFLPKHPTTRPRLQDILASEALLDETELIRLALASEEIVTLQPRDEL
ncbi:MAG: tRNA 4-thiouridine(8) synthase ThiI [Eubacteriales bacterium]|jgi:thiamine biosynthesis protein ThiI|nr:tRNA 4-thiouridine(8) synthase ThiI [Eubacteriales bacterium]MDD3290388.1 tRNA 4-thiouridine(8) synthase ThiI [Eubacteriales bacterium]MDD3863352.1 tRNA 4-thiouridine(8) synthase ThiI [Eubacteriales bacterium]MDD4444721.1 tRNA 4-thiouridine(8) synthase ThiI [Eubacteriales bacterium]